MLRICGILFLSLTFALSSAACGNDGAKTKELKAGATKQHTVKARAHPSSNKQISEEIVKDIKKVKGIKKATVIVHNRDAIIGIDVKKAKDTKAIEEKVRKAVEHAKPNYTVHVTTDTKIHARIQRIHTNMIPLDGHPIHNFSEDIGILIHDMGNTMTKPLR